MRVRCGKQQRKVRHYKMKHKTLEQQIQELWESRGLEVLEERVRALDNEKFEWIIIAKKKIKS